MSKLTDTQIHRIELLLTISYLLKFSDAKHPVSQLDICRYATNFGLKFDEKNLSGNDIRRQRIKDVLVFLEELSNRFSENFPFKVSCTEKGKYYIENRFNLSKGDIFNIIFSIENNRFIKEEVSKDLKNKILNLLSSKNEKIEFEKTLELVMSPKDKYSTYTSSTLSILMNAIKKEKIVQLKRLNYVYDEEKKDYVLKDVVKRYRVYTIKEYSGKLYALLIAIADGEIILEDVRSIHIIGQKKWRFAEDLVKNRDLNKLFIENNVNGKSLETYIKEAKMPLNKNTRKISFSFNGLYLRMIETSFRDYFSEKLTFEVCDKFEVDKSENEKKLVSLNSELSEKMTEKYIESKIIDEDANVIANISVNVDSFSNRVLSNPIFPQIITVYDDFVNRRLAHHFKELSKKYENYL